MIIEKPQTLLKNNEYPGRGIMVGKTADGENAVIVYFIMGRSENSRNRIFQKSDDGIIIYPFDESKVEDPSLIIYSPIRAINNSIIVTNGDQTDTVYDYMKKGKTFEDALRTRCFEPDAPNYTPRISAILNFEQEFTYKMSILKSADENGSACNRFTFDYSPLNGVGHFIHTYECNGNPIPTFKGEPEAVEISNDFEKFSDGIWNSLNENNKISLYVEFINLKTKAKKARIYNKHN